ncbi:unnamed protein product [Closterium sp. Naga37s-1]|nr:unnamed protein product [Closterium sp. Naga37s-1]
MACPVAEPVVRLVSASLPQPVAHALPAAAARRRRATRCGILSPAHYPQLHPAVRAISAAAARRPSRYPAARRQIPATPGRGGGGVLARGGTAGGGGVAGLAAHVRGSGTAPPSDATTPPPRSLCRYYCCGREVQGVWVVRVQLQHHPPPPLIPCRPCLAVHTLTRAVPTRLCPTRFTRASLASRAAPVFPCCPRVPVLPPCSRAAPMLPCCPALPVLPRSACVVPVPVPCCPVQPLSCPVLPVLPRCPRVVPVLPVLPLSARVLPRSARVLPHSARAAPFWPFVPYPCCPYPFVPHPVCAAWSRAARHPRAARPVQHLAATRTRYPYPCSSHTVHLLRGVQLQPGTCSTAVVQMLLGGCCLSASEGAPCWCSHAL